MDPIEVFTLSVGGKFLAYTKADPGNPARGDTEHQAVVSLLEKQGAITRKRIRHEEEQEPVVVDLKPAGKDGLTLAQAQEHARKGARITRAGCESRWYLMLLPSFAPSWALFTLGEDGKPAPPKPGWENPSRWPVKAPRHHQETSAHVEAVDWKVIDDLA